MGGFQQAEDNGGKISEIWPPLVIPDYTPYVAQISDCDGVRFCRLEPAALHEAMTAPACPGCLRRTGGDDALPGWR
jgi:hypothetical protein